MSARTSELRPLERPEAPTFEVLRDAKPRRGIRRVPARVIVALICVALPVAAVLLEQVALAQSAFRLQELRQELSHAEELHEELLLETAQLESPARIEQYAREVLGMQEPQRLEYLVADIPAGGRARKLAAPPAGLAAQNAAARAATVVDLP